MAKRPQRLKRLRASKRLTRSRRKAGGIRGAHKSQKETPLDKASRLARAATRRREKQDPDVRDRIKVFFIPERPGASRARWTVRSWRKFMGEERYKWAVAELLLRGSFVLGLQDDDGDIEEELDTLIAGV